MDVFKDIKLIVFDVDGTLTNDISWYNITQELGADQEMHRQIFQDFKAGLITYPKAKDDLIKIWQSTGNANKQFMKKVFLSWSLKDDAKETINYLCKKYQICLMSGAMDLYVKTVAEQVNVKDWYANTELVWDENDNLIDFHYFADQSLKKLKHFHDYINKYKFDKSECMIVGDGDSDIAVFKEIKGIAINKEQHTELENLAFMRITKLSELKELL